MLTINSLQYPFKEISEFGSLKQIATGVNWLRMPLPMALDQTNLYLLEDDAGWYTVDTGMRGDDQQEYWQQIFDTALGVPLFQPSIQDTTLDADGVYRYKALDPNLADRQPPSNHGQQDPPFMV